MMARIAFYPLAAIGCVLATLARPVLWLLMKIVDDLDYLDERRYQKKHG